MTSYDFDARIYTPGYARFLSVDPITSDLPGLSPYQFASNSPIWCIDFDGLEGVPAQLMSNGMYSTAISTTAPRRLIVKDIAYENLIKNTSSPSIDLNISKATFKQYNPTGLNQTFFDTQQKKFATEYKIQKFIETGRELYPAQFGGGDFGFGTNQGLKDAWNEGVIIAAQLETVSRFSKGVRTLSKSFKTFSKTTKGQFTGVGHQKLRSEAFKEYIINFNINVDKGEKIINTTFDVIAPVQKVKDTKKQDGEKE